VMLHARLKRHLTQQLQQQQQAHRLSSSINSSSSRGGQVSHSAHTHVLKG
jgi:hypothetical protein